MKKSKKGRIKKLQPNKNDTSKYFPAIVAGVVACCVGFCLTYFTLGNNPSSVSSTISTYTHRTNFNVSCSGDYKDHKVFEHCTPIKTCSRIVTDSVVDLEEASMLLNIAKRGLAHGGSNGGASILDLHSGALSMGEKFVNIYTYLEHDALHKTFTPDDFKFYAIIKDKVHETIAKEFGVENSKLYLTHPTFFSRITNASAKTKHDEYWHRHIDKIQYGSFDYTSLLYLSDYEKDFTGGRFIFDDAKNLHVEPKRGRLSFFTSGSENPHHVEQVTSGERYAITISFTCDPKKAIKDPTLKDT